MELTCCGVGEMVNSTGRMQREGTSYRWGKESCRQEISLLKEKNTIKVESGEPQYCKVHIL